MFRATNDTLDQAIDSTVKLKFNVKNQAFINQLKTNAKVFSAFKSHHQGKALQALLVDQDGKVLPFSTFKKEALKVTDTYNKTWLKTEYNTALRRGRIGAKFQRFKEDQDQFPNLRWVPSTSAEPRSAHIRFYGIVLPINDPFWVNQFPGNEWNCKCDVEQTRGRPSTRPDSLEVPPNGLEGNPAFSGSLFGDRHPYFKGLNKSEKDAVSLTVRKEVNRNLNAWAKENVDKEKGLIRKADALQTKALVLKRSFIQNVIKDQDDAFVKTYATVLPDDLSNLKYLGFEKSRSGIFSHYESEYGDQKVFIKMKVINDSEQPISLDFKIDKSIIIKENIPEQ